MALVDPIPSVSAGPATGPTDAGPAILVERPSPGLAQGNYPWPAWAIGVLGGALVFAASVYLVLRYRSAYRERNRRT